jgi:hypothetical protein
MPRMGKDVAIDASDLPAYANGQRFVSKGGRERAPERFGRLKNASGSTPTPFRPILVFGGQE